MKILFLQYIDAGSIHIRQPEQLLPCLFDFKKRLKVITIYVLL